LLGGGGSTSVNVPPFIGTVAVPGPQVPGPLGVPAAEIEYCADAAGATMARVASAAARANASRRGVNG